MACAWMGVFHALPSCWVIRASALGVPLWLDSRPTLHPPMSLPPAPARPPYLGPPGAPPRPPCVYGGAARPSQATPVGSPPTPPATPGFPAHTHCGVDPGTARSINERSEHPSTGKFSLGELHPPCDIRSPHAGPAGPVVPAELRRAWRRCRWCNISYVIPCRHGGMIWPGEVAWLHGMAWYGIVTWCGWMTARHIRS